MKRHWFHSSIGLFMLSLPAYSGQAGSVPTPLTLDICLLAHTPQKYAGQMVQVRGSILTGYQAPGKPIKAFVLTEPFSSISCAGTHILAVLPATIKPKPNFDLEVDESFKAFEKALHERTAIEGTFQGRLEYKKGKSATRLIIQKISDLKIEHTSRIDR